MNDTEIVKRLSTLLQMDRDAVRLYDEAGRIMGVQDLGIDADSAREEHRRHASEIEQAIRDRRQEPRPATAEFESIMQLHFDSVRHAKDADETMITLRMAERIMNLEYAEILQMEMSQDLRATLESNLADEKRHLAKVEAWLEKHVGAQTGVYL